MTHDSVNQQVSQSLMPTCTDLKTVLEQASQHRPCALPKRGRPPALRREHLALSILMCFLQGWHAQRQVWRLITGTVLGPFAPLDLCDEAIYQQLARHGVTCLQALFDQVSLWLRQRLIPYEDRELAPFAREVLALDESTLSRVGRWLPSLRDLPKNHPDLLAGRLSALFDLRRQQWWHVALLPEAVANCKLYVEQLLPHVRPGSLLVFDRGYLSFALFDTLTAQGFWWVTRYANKVSYQILHVYYSADGVLDALVQLGTSGDRAAYTVRLLSIRRGGKPCIYLTNVVDPYQWPLAQVVEVYARRWDIELAFRVLKDHLPGNQMWSAKWNVIGVHIWACLILAQCFHALQVELAAQAHVPIFDVSIHLLVQHVLPQIQQGHLPFGSLLAYAQRTGMIRPSTRIRYAVPHIPWLAIAWPVGPVIWWREPRYKQRNCGPMADRAHKRSPF